MVQPATLDDLDALVDLEHRCFDSDRLSRRSFRRMITRANAALLIDREGDALRGYALVLFHAGSSLARLYSVAVDPAHRGHGIARTLLAEAERVAGERDCIDMRLELRRDNSDALKLYEASGYRQFDVQADYYEDHMDAVRMEKSLVPPLPSHKVRVPYYEQTLDFTCGSAAMLMAMQALDPNLVPSRKLELRIWREATTVYMTSGHGGCGPYGLALSAHHRGFNVEVWIDGGVSELFVDSVRNEEKKTVIRLVQQDFLEELAACGIPLLKGPVTIDRVQEAFEAGGIPVVLTRDPHWVVVTGFDERFVYVHDPYVDEDENQSRVDCVNRPILKKEFSSMARYGRDKQRAVIIVKERRCPNT
ncbi:MAG: GNAT family N-acetyltransferase/peptidase C39 family protein [Gammaproteobacteria bacterium]